MASKSPERRYTLDNPAEGHEPSVGRFKNGMSMTVPARQRYGTNLRCSCGHPFSHTRRSVRLDDGTYGDVWEPNRRGRVSNDAPSKGGRKSAQARYRQHLRELDLMD